MAAMVEQLGLAPDALAGQVAVVTGAGQGIGREAALALAQLGARVVVADIADEAGEETAALIRSAGGTATFVHTDVAREADVSRLAMWTLADFGPAGLLVNNAIVSSVASVAEMTPDVWDQTIAVNLRGAYLTCRAFLPGMQLAGNGRIINMVSTDAMAHMSAYIASKQGLAGFTQSLAAEVGHQGVQVVALAPGFVDTPGLRAAGEKLAPRLGMDAATFARLSFHPAYDGMMPAAHAGAATAYLAARLMADCHGEVVTGYTVLERAGVLTPQASEGARAGAAGAAHVAEDALALCRRLEAILAETDAEFGKLPLFVRPLARSGFKAKAGLSLQEWVRTAAMLTQQAAGGAVTQHPPLEQLAAYYRGVPAETARFTKDETLLKQAGATSTERVALIERLLAALRL